jgi:hypothetical protein
VPKKETPTSTESHGALCAVSSQIIINSSLTVNPRSVALSHAGRWGKANAPREGAVRARSSPGQPAIRSIRITCSSCPCPNRLYSSASARRASSGASPHVGGATDSVEAPPSVRARFRGRCAESAARARSAPRMSTASRWKAPNEKFEDENAAAEARPKATLMPHRPSDASLCQLSGRYHDRRMKCRAVLFDGRHFNVTTM